MRLVGSLAALSLLIPAAGSTPLTAPAGLTPGPILGQLAADG